jgi:allantoate deiminase
MKPKVMNQEIISHLKQSSRNLEIQYCSINSGAGHDAMVFSDFTDVGMVFIPSKDGLSHCPEEWSDAGDIAKAVQILYETTKKLTEADEK